MDPPRDPAAGNSGFIDIPDDLINPDPDVALGLLTTDLSGISAAFRPVSTNQFDPGGILANQQ
jgi:hypothetical protein